VRPSSGTLGCSRSWSRSLGRTIRAAVLRNTRLLKILVALL